MRFHIRFDQPMVRGVAREYVRLLDEKGVELEHAIRSTEAELWDPSSQQLTLLLNPGRNKSGVAPNRSRGTSLTAAQDIRLVILGGWPSTEGRSTPEAFSRTYSVLDAQRERVDPYRWELSAPEVSSRAALQVHFGRSLDRFLIEHSLALVEDGRSVPCCGEVGDDGSWVALTPVAPWHPNRSYHLRVDTRLEDLAGNNVASAFERPIAGFRGAAGPPHVLVPITFTTAKDCE